MRIACVGEATASIFRKHNLEVELVPETATAENLAKALVATDPWTVRMSWSFPGIETER